MRVFRDAIDDVDARAEFEKRVHLTDGERLVLLALYVAGGDHLAVTDRRVVYTLTESVSQEIPLAEVQSINEAAEMHISETSWLNVSIAGANAGIALKVPWPQRDKAFLFIETIERARRGQWDAIRALDLEGEGCEARVEGGAYKTFVCPVRGRQDDLKDLAVAAATFVGAFLLVGVAMVAAQGAYSGVRNGINLFGLLVILGTLGNVAVKLWYFLRGLPRRSAWAVNRRRLARLLLRGEGDPLWRGGVAIPSVVAARVETLLDRRRLTFALEGDAIVARGGNSDIKIRREELADGADLERLADALSEVQWSDAPSAAVARAEGTHPSR